MSRIEAAYDAIKYSSATDYDRYVVAAMMGGYDAQWLESASEFEVISVEEEFCLPILTPATGRKMSKFWHAGKRDGIIKRDGKTYLLEHKTTGESIDEPDDDYWRRLVIDSQINGYVLALWQQGVMVDGTLYDVIKKPTIRHKRLTKDAVEEISSRKAYCDYEVTQATIDAVRGCEIDSENDELFAIRVRKDCMEFPNKYFQRREIFRTRQELEEHTVELYQIARDIRQAERDDNHYKNASACTMYGSTCEYLPLCSGNDMIESDSWKERNILHAELDLSSQPGLYPNHTVLTNSRMKTFLSCRKKHHYKYNMRLERVTRQDSAALTFGTLFHLALEAWWSFSEEPKVEQQRVDQTNEPSGHDEETSQEDAFVSGLVRD